MRAKYTDRPLCLSKRRPGHERSTYKTLNWWHSLGSVRELIHAVMHVILCVFKSWVFCVGEKCTFRKISPQNACQCSLYFWYRFHSTRLINNLFFRPQTKSKNRLLFNPATPSTHSSIVLTQNNRPVFLVNGLTSWALDERFVVHLWEASLLEPEVGVLRKMEMYRSFCCHVWSGTTSLCTAWCNFVCNMISKQFY